MVIRKGYKNLRSDYIRYKLIFLFFLINIMIKVKRLVKRICMLMVELKN